VAFRLNKISDQNVVLEDLQGHNRASKNLALSVDPEDGMQDTELTADDELGIGVALLWQMERQPSCIYVNLFETCSSIAVTGGRKNITKQRYQNFETKMKRSLHF
jgi:hypothetical protein